MCLQNNVFRSIRQHVGYWLACGWYWQRSSWLQRHIPQTPKKEPWRISSTELNKCACLVVKTPLRNLRTLTSTAAGRELLSLPSGAAQLHALTAQTPSIDFRETSEKTASKLCRLVSCAVSSDRRPHSKARSQLHQWPYCAGCGASHGYPADADGSFCLGSSVWLRAQVPT